MRAYSNPRAVIYQTQWRESGKPRGRFFCVATHQDRSSVSPERSRAFSRSPTNSIRRCQTGDASSSCHWSQVKKIRSSAWSSMSVLTSHSIPLRPFPTVLRYFERYCHQGWFAISIHSLFTPYPLICPAVYIDRCDYATLKINFNIDICHFHLLSSNSLGRI